MPMESHRGKDHLSPTSQSPMSWSKGPYFPDSNSSISALQLWNLTMRRQKLLGALEFGRLKPARFKSHAFICRVLFNRSKRSDSSTFRRLSLCNLQQRRDRKLPPPSKLGLESGLSIFPMFGKVCIKQLVGVLLLLILICTYILPQDLAKSEDSCLLRISVHHPDSLSANVCHAIHHLTVLVESCGAIRRCCPRGLKAPCLLFSFSASKHSAGSLNFGFRPCTQRHRGRWH